MNQQVKYQQVTVLRFAPQQGRATSAKVTIKTKDDLDLRTAVSEVAATVDTVSTTVDVASGASETNTKRVYLASTTGIVAGGLYLLSGADGSEWVEVTGVSAGDYVTVRANLRHDYAITTSTFVGTELTYSLSADNAQDPNEDCDVDFRCEWTYVVAGETYIRETLYDVTRHPWYRAASLVGLKRWNADLFSRFDMETGTDWEADLDEAFDRLIERIDARGPRPNCIVGMDKLAVPTYWQLAYQKALAGVIPAHAVNDPDNWIDRVETGVEKALDVALKNVSWVDLDQDNAKDDGESGAALRVIRITT